MFRSNMMILFTALVALMLILVGVLVIFEGSFENQFHSLTQTRLDSHIEEAARLVREAQPGEEEQLRQELAGWDYQTALIADGSVLSGDRSENMKDLAEHFIMEDNSSGETGIYLCQNASVAGKSIEEENAVLVAVHFTDDERVYRNKSGIRGVGNKRCGKEMPLFLFVLNETPQLSSRISLRQHGNFHNLFIN